MSKRLPPPGPRPIAILAVACLAVLAGRQAIHARVVPRRTRGPYLQLLTDESVTIVWQTDTAAACSLSIRPAGGSPRMIAGPTATTCAIAVDGLSPGTSYGYTPLADDAAVDEETVFKTDDRASTTFDFLVVGDHGDHPSSTMLPIRDRMLVTPADFVISTGDMIYPDGAAEDFDPKFFVPYAALLRRLVFWPCIGNHDDHSSDGIPWREAFRTPANNPEHDEDYYSFDYGDARVVMLESNQDPIAPGSPQYQFLDRELTNTTATWKIVVWHHAVYSTGSKHGSNLELRTNLGPLLDGHDVDLVFNGHEHNYERTHPMRGGQVVGPGEGTVYITTGGGGADLDPLDAPKSFTAYAEESFHFVHVAVDGGRLRADMVRADGSIGDSVTLEKTIAPPPPPPPPTTVEARRFPAQADGYVASRRPRRTFGRRRILRVVKQRRGEMIGFLRFAVTGTAGLAIDHATLELTPRRGRGTLGVYRATETGWPEERLSFSARPPLDGPALGTQTPLPRHQPLAFDVTRAVHGDGPVSFAITSTRGLLDLYSREAARGQPALTLYLRPAPR